MATSKSWYQTIAIVLLMTGLFSAALMHFGRNEDTTIIPNLYRQILQQKHLVSGSNDSNKTYLIFQIGFNKAGTSALKDFFSANSIAACHYDAFGLPLAQNMYKQQLKNGSVLTPFFKNNSIHFQYYADFGVYVQPNQIEDILFLNQSYRNGGPYRTWYELLLYQNSEYEKLFILNIRNVNAWIKSRYRWHTYHCRDIEWFSECAAFAVNKTFNDQIDEIEVLYRWKRLWYQYICDLLTYFEEHNQMHKLIVFDIERDSPNKLSQFFNGYGFNLNASFYGMSHDHKSVNFAKKHPKEDGERLQKWNKIEKMYPELASDYDEYNNEHDRIAMMCKRSII